MNVRLFVPVLLITLLQGCRSCWIIEPDTPITTVTRYVVQSHQFYKPGSFSATLDGENVTAQFHPTLLANNKTLMLQNGPFTGGEPGTTGVYIGEPQRPEPTRYASGGRQHVFHVECRCVEGAMCGYSDEIKFVPLNFSASPSPIDISAASGAVNITLTADRPLTAPVVVTVSAHLLGANPTAPANHIRINGAAPGAAVPLTLTPAGGSVYFYVQNTSPGGFWLRFEAPGAAVGSVTGVAH